MTDYIRKSMALEALRETLDLLIEKTTGLDYVPLVAHFQQAMKVIEVLPSVDVVEQKHGKWLYRGDHGGPNCLYVCSVCNTEIRTYRPEAWNYCPNCGARVDGDS